MATFSPRLLKAGLLLPTAAGSAFAGDESAPPPESPAPPPSAPPPAAPPPATAPVPAPAPSAAPAPLPLPGAAPAPVPLAQPSDDWLVGPVFGVTGARMVIPRFGSDYSVAGGFGGDYLVRVALGVHVQHRNQRATERTGRPHTLVLEPGYQEFGSRFGSGALVAQEITLPVLFRVDYPLPGVKPRPSIEWGPQVGFKIAEGISYGIYSYSIGDYSLLPVDVGMNVGFGLVQPVGGTEASVHLRFYQGFVPVGGDALFFYSQVGLFGGWYF